ncbi:MAG: prolyl oligopeptidase family serine peptidase [Acidobacteriota bacterium]
MSVRFRVAPLALILAALVVVAVAAPVTGDAAGPVAAVEASQRARPMTPEDVARLRSVSEVSISPDGGHVAYTLSVPRDPASEPDGPAWSELHVVPFDGGASRPYVTGRVNVSGVTWGPDGRWITYLARREGDDSTALWAIPVAGGESIRVLDHHTGISAFAWRPDGGAVAFVAGEPVAEEVKARRERGFDQEIYEETVPARQLWVAELPEGPGGPVGDVRHLDAFEGHPYGIAWSADGSRLLIDPAPTPLVDDRYMYRRLRIVDAATGTVNARIDNPGKPGEFELGADGETVLMISGVDIHDPAEGRLMVLGPETEQLRDLLPGLEGHVEDFAPLSEDSVLYLAAVGVGARLGRVDLDGSGGEVLWESDDLVLGSISLDESGTRLAAVAHSSTTPGELHVLRLDDPEPERLTHSNPWLSEVALAPQEAISWSARDGLEVEGLLIRPLERPQGEAVPTIVVVHGGPESRYANGWLTGYSQPGQVAAGRGYAVFYPNYRGSTGRGVEFTKAHQHDGVGAEFEDVLDGIDHLVETGLTDPDRVGITGGSYGGYFTAWGATAHSDRFAAGVMFVGISDQLSKALTSDIPDELELVHWRTNPFEDLQLFLDRSPVLHVDGADTPLLILHGKEDSRVYPGQSLELYRALKMRGEAPVRLVLYPGEGHGNRRAASRYDYNLRMMRWFDHFLMGDGEELPEPEVDHALEEPATAR